MKKDTEKFGVCESLYEAVLTTTKPSRDFEAFAEIRVELQTFYYIMLSTLHIRLKSSNGFNILKRAIASTRSRTSRHTYATSAPTRTTRRTRRVALGAIITFGSIFGYLYATDTRASAHSWLAIPLVRGIWHDAEEAHEAGTGLLKHLYRFGLHPRERTSLDGLSVPLFGYQLDNPLGISAGLDKHGDIPTQLFSLGAAIVEIGGITPLPQVGNPKPRVWRLPSLNSMVNRYGLNSDGADVVAERLRRRVREYAYQNGFGSGPDAEQYILDGKAGVPAGSLIQGKLLAVQVAKNESTSNGDIEAIGRDYVYAVNRLARYADIITVNVSCPNSPGFSQLQQARPLTAILNGVVAAAKAVDRENKPAVLVKVSPDDDAERQISTICAAVWASGADGVIVGNTTKKRPPPSEGTILSGAEIKVMRESGGLSGPQLFDQTINLVKKYRSMLDIPLREQMTEEEASNYLRSGTPVPAGADNPKVIFASGGITTGSQALEALISGASVAQIYTGKRTVAEIRFSLIATIAMVYGGVGKITSMKAEMKEEIER